MGRSASAFLMGAMNSLTPIHRLPSAAAGSAKPPYIARGPVASLRWQCSALQPYLGEAGGCLSGIVIVTHHQDISKTVAIQVSIDFPNLLNG